MTNLNTNINLILTGFMGTGKSTVGKIVAEKLGRRFVDMDELIIQRAGRSVPEIFKQHGEPAFRAWEAAFCKELSKPAGLVISTGGGALVPEENRRVMSAPGNIIICLTAAPEALRPRLEATRDRPLAQSWEGVLSLYQKRMGAYRAIRLKLDTTSRTPEQTADAVIRLYQREQDRNRMRTKVRTPEGSYDLFVGNGLLEQLPRLMVDYGLTGRTVVVTNETIAPLYGEVLADELPNAALVTMRDGESYKNLQTVEKLYDDFVAAGLDRSGIVVALGGGVVGDTAGYAAATYMRGVRLIQIPTSLLAMVDSSVGGKVGVDIPAGKNLVGAFKQPEMVLIDPDVLKTLPEIEIRCGLAEAVKHGLLADRDLLDHVQEIAAGDADWLRRNIQVKVDVVERDPYEQGERAHLNLGHTFGHAIEQVSGYQWRHGEGVGFGLVAAARLSAQVSTLSQADANFIENVVEKIGLPTRISGLDPEAIWETMKTDKKWHDGRSHFVVLEAIGKPTVMRDIPRDMIIDLLASLTLKATPIPTG